MRKEDETTSHEQRGSRNPEIVEDGNAKDTANADQAAAENDSLASKLSKELNSWRRRRTTSRPSRAEGNNQNHSEPARTIKVRGHETLVVRKSKLVVRPGSENSVKDE
ncbi:MAG: hypothetical protein ACREQB_08575 [Candidatus Binataceae bacterium]